MPFSVLDLKRRKTSGGFAITLRGRLTPIVTGAPDDVHAGMWRVEGSDMVNVDRAVEAAMYLALNIINAPAAGDEISGAGEEKSATQGAA